MTRHDYMGDLPKGHAKPEARVSGLFRIATACLAAGMLCACGGLPKNIERPRSHAMPDTGDTALSKAVASALTEHSGESAFYPLTRGMDAYVARIALARAAHSSLDLQYYVFHADDTGLALLGELFAAADRGVRIRLLLDDIHLSGQDSALAAMDAHPNIEVRLFNPFAHRGARWVDLVTDFRRINRRMHNKSFTADGQLTIVGGRNIGNEYFAAHSEVDFSDLDVLAAGPVVSEVAAVFDEYWNSTVAYPVAALTAAPDANRLNDIRGKLAQHTQSLRDTPYVRALLQTDLAQQIDERQLHFFRGKASVIADQADKVNLPTDDSSTHVIPQFVAYLQQAETELILVSPYFVPEKNGVKWLADVARRGVRVRVLTNSFAATDVSAVHAGYAPYRKALLQAGIELYELKPAASSKPGGDKKSLIGSSRASLHAKTYMVDRRLLFIGSLNLDPRSVRLNTEMGVIMESPELCALFGDEFDQRILEVAYRVQLEKAGERDSGHLVWVTREDGEDRRYEREPGIGPLQRIGQTLLRILPIEGQL